MGNIEYATAFSEVVLPLISDFNPDLIIIACGFDAAVGEAMTSLSRKIPAVFIFSQ